VAGDTEGTEGMWIPKNLYELTKSYFSQLTKTMLVNSLSTEKEISRGCP